MNKDSDTTEEQKKKWRDYKRDYFARRKALDITERRELIEKKIVKKNGEQE